jgi:cytochrome c
VAELFRLGPDVVMPGTKMPVQRITDEAALAALIEFLGRAAMPAR